eukprot:scaffold18137_cov127-Skeletonema_marinoi.AAC.1
MQYTTDAKGPWLPSCKSNCQRFIGGALNGRDKGSGSGSFKSTNDKAHDNNKHATNNFDAGNTIIAQFMLDDRDVTLQRWCEEAGGRQTKHKGSSVLLMMVFYGVLLAALATMIGLHNLGLSR